MAFDWWKRRRQSEGGMDPEGGAPAPETPEQAWLQRLSTLMPRRVYAIAVAVALGAGAGILVAECVPKKEGTVQVDTPVDPEHDPILESTHTGDWDFKVYRTFPISVKADQNGVDVFVKSILQKQEAFKKLTGQDQAYVVSAYTELLKKLNPDLDLTGSTSLKGQQLTFPDYVQIVPHFEHAIDKEHEGYDRIQDLAEEDGFPVTDTKKQAAIYDAALKQTSAIPASSYYFHKDDGKNDSPTQLEADVTARLETMAEKFATMSTSQGTGFKLYYTDVLRNPATNATRQGSSKGTTHSTGRSFDLANGRFQTPDGKEFTYTDPETGAPSAYASLIETELRPNLIKAAEEAGLVLFVEGTHWHTYAPKIKTIDTAFRHKQEVKSEGPSMQRSEAQTKMESALDTYVESISAREVDPSAMQKLQEFDALRNRIFPEGSRPSYHKILCTDSAESKADDVCLYDTPSEELMTRYGSSTLEDLQTKIEANTEKKGDTYNDMIRVRNAMLRERLMGIVKGLTNDQIVQKGIFDGSVVSRFGDIEKAWQFKRSNHATDDLKYYPTLKIEGKNHSVSMEAWFEKQKAAAAYLKLHGQELGFRRDLTDYMGPALVLATIHAEFFSEFSADTFVRMVPMLFEAHNLVYGPSMGDGLFSGGLVQMISPTFRGILNQYGPALADLQTKDASYTLLVPGVKTYVDKVTVSKGKGRKRRTYTVDHTSNEYDREVFPKAMIFDLDSQLFYDQLGILYHISPGMETLLADAEFKAAWDNASEQDRYRFLGAFSAMSNNAGPYSKIADILVTKVKSSALNDYTSGLAAACREKYGTRAKATTTSRGALRGLATMDLLVDGAGETTPDLMDQLRTLVASAKEQQAPTTPNSVVAVPAKPAPSAAAPAAKAPEKPVAKSAPVVAGKTPVAPQITVVQAKPAERVPLYTDYTALRDQALVDGYKLSATDDDVNDATYQAAKTASVAVPTSGDYFRKAGQTTEARMVPEALSIFANVAARFKDESGGYILCFTETLQSPDYRETISSVSDATFYTGRTVAVPNGRFKTPDGREITVSIPDPKHKGQYMRGPDAGKVEELQKILVRILEEYQADHFVVALDASATGGGYQLYFPKQKTDD